MLAPCPLAGFLGLLRGQAKTDEASGYATPAGGSVTMQDRHGAFGRAVSRELAAPDQHINLRILLVEQRQCRTVQPHQQIGAVVYHRPRREAPGLGPGR